MKITCNKSNALFITKSWCKKIFNERKEAIIEYINSLQEVKEG